MIDTTKLRQYAARLDWEENSNARSIAYELLGELRQAQNELKAERQRIISIVADVINPEPVGNDTLALIIGKITQEDKSE